MRIWTYLIFGSLIVVLASAAFLPLLDVNLLIHEMSVTNEPVDTHFLAIRSATFASLVFYYQLFAEQTPSIRSWTNAPFCNFLVFFGAVLMIKRAQFELLPWVVLCMIAALSVFLHRENKAQNNVIFRDSW